MKKINLSVPAMQSLHCQNNVKKSVESLGEIKITNLKPGSLEVEIPDDYLINYVYTAVQSAGYEIMGVEKEEGIKKNGQVLTFKSNINCMGCVESVAMVLNNNDAIEGWQVDLKSKDKILTIESKGISKEEIIHLIQSKGYKAESINS